MPYELYLTFGNALSAKDLKAKFNQSYYADKPFFYSNSQKLWTDKVVLKNELHRLMKLHDKRYQKWHRKAVAAESALKSVQKAFTDFSTE